MYEQFIQKIVAVMLQEPFCSHYLCPLVPFDGIGTADQYKALLNDHLHPVMKHDGSAPIHRA